VLTDLLHPPQAILALADGTVFRGQSIGATGQTVGEVVFNTSLTGYQEILTDPSYCRQIVTLTYPHIGSYGVSPEDVESSKVYAAGLVVKDLPVRASNFRANQTLDAYLREQGTVAIKFVIDPNGSVSECAVATSSGKPRLDDAACTMVKRRWKYKPATQDGKPVSIQQTANVVFQLR